MKNLLSKSKNILVIVATLSLTMALHAQQPWRFHIAFEDGTGARDTLWMVFDTTATMLYFDTITHQEVPTVDYELGEGPINFDYSIFNVFIYNELGDSTKTKAYPYSIYPSITTDNVYAMNYTYPITIRWDTTLFHSSFLADLLPMNTAFIGGSYQFYILGYDPTSTREHTTNMLSKNIVSCPEDLIFGIQLFGDLIFVIYYDVSLNTQQGIYKEFRIYPNPTQTVISIKSTDLLKSYYIYDIQGNQLFAENFESPRKLDGYEIPYNSYRPGFYIVKTINLKNQIYYEKFIYCK